MKASPAHTGKHANSTAYPRLLRIFTGSIAIALLCSLTGIALEDSKVLHSAPFLAMAALCALTAAVSFLLMLVCLLAEVTGVLRNR